MRMKRGNTPAWLAMLTLAIASLGSAHATEQPEALQVWIEPTCPSVAPPLRPQSVLGALVIEGLLSAAINTAVDAAGSYFTAAAQTRSTALKGSVDDVFYTLDAQGQLAPEHDAQGCVVLMVQGPQPSQPWFDAARERSENLRRVDRLPRFYFEASFDPAPGNTHEFIVRTRMLHVSNFLEDGWNYGNDRAYSVAFTLRSLEDYKAFGQLSFSFAAVRPGTWAESDVIRNQPLQRDSSIKPLPPDWVSAQRVPFHPVSAAIESAVNAQKLAAAPFQKAVRLLNATPPEPALQEPEWLVRVGPAANPAIARFTATLHALCESIDKLKEKKIELPRDARCPVSHLQAANELEDARAALRAQMELEWAKAFFARYQGKACKKDKDDKVVCAPPLRGQPQQGQYAWEAAVVETREPNALAKAVASAFSANKDKLKTALENEVIPSRRVAEAAKDEAAGRDALVAYRLAILKVDEEEAKLQEAVAKPRSEQIVLQAAVLRAKVAANTAARAASLPPPFEI